MKILLIGNGFDLEHHLPTTYRDFLSFCEKASKIFTSPRTMLINEFEEDNLTGWEATPFIKEALRIAFSGRGPKATWLEDNWTHAVTTPYPELDELYANMKDNAWLNYFWKCPSYLGENWIDFESEISKVIQAMEDWRAQVGDGHSIAGISLSERNLLAAIVNASDAEFQDLFKKDVTVVDKYSEYLRRELDRLTRALEIYLAGFVQKIEIDGKSADIENLQPDRVLSFNYSNTYERVYGQGRKIVYDYIHGKAKLAGSVDTCDLVLGIDEYLDDDRKNKDLEFLTFKKYYQDLAPYGIRCNCIAPGVVDTPVHQDHRDRIMGYVPFFPLGRIQETNDVVGTAIFLASDASCFITGQVIHVNGGMIMVD